MYSVVITDKAKKQLAKLDKVYAKLIFNFLSKEELQANPRFLGKSLKGNLNIYWRYRVGQYRIIATIDDNQLIITTVNIGHRKDIYK